nr:uncharacterized protein LOC123761670 isoform X1 [Procambarus clarkii]
MTVMAVCENCIQTLSSLSVKNCIVFLRVVLHRFVKIKFAETCASFLRESLQSIPPNFHAEFLDKLAPIFDSITNCPLDKNVLDIIDELALILLSPSITQIDVGKFKFPTRNPSKYLMALQRAKNMKMLISYRENVWKYSLSKFELLSSALIKMPMLRHLTLRHIRIDSCKINDLLLGLASNSPHLVYLDMKYGMITDSGLDPDSVGKFGKVANFADCIPALLNMKRLQHLNVSETWLTYVGIKAIVKHLPLQRLDAIIDGGYDLQAVVIKDSLLASEDTTLSLPRTSYTFTPGETNVQAICKACPNLECITIQHCSVGDIRSYFEKLANLQHLKKVTLCGLEWDLLRSHIAINEDPMPISNHVTEVTLTEPCQADAYHLGALSICFPQITHLWVIGPRQDNNNDAWDGGRVFSNLMHLYFQGEVFTEDFGRIEREQGLQNMFDVLLTWCRNLRSLTLYTNSIEGDKLYFAVKRNGLRRLEELRIGLQHDLDVDVIFAILQRTNDLRILGRTDWWTSINEESKLFLIDTFKARYRNLEVYGLDDYCDVAHEPRPLKNNSSNVPW